MVDRVNSSGKLDTFEYFIIIIITVSRNYHFLERSKFFHDCSVCKLFVLNDLFWYANACNLTTATSSNYFFLFLDTSSFKTPEIVIWKYLEFFWLFWQMLTAVDPNTSEMIVLVVSWRQNKTYFHNIANSTYIFLHVKLNFLYNICCRMTWLCQWVCWVQVLWYNATGVNSSIYCFFRCIFLVQKIYVYFLRCLWFIIF